jgi:hypothetical protein
MQTQEAIIRIDIASRWHQRSGEESGMKVDAAVAFLATHGRALERRRAEVLLAGTGGDAALAVLDGYRNDDGGYGWGLEPDLRSPESQPAAAKVAFEVMGEVASPATPHAVELCDWVDQRSFPDGALPMVMPITDPSACVSVWVGADPESPSLQMTAQVVAGALRVAVHDPAVRDHPWLARATTWCLGAVDGVDATTPAYELLFAVRFLDALADVDARAVTALERLRPLFPPDGVVPVQGGLPDEQLRPLDFAPHPGAARSLFTDETIARDLERLDRAQQPDGGWTVDYEAVSSAAALEWRGIATVNALTTLGVR